MMGDEVEPETRNLVQRATDVLVDLGATVEPVNIPLIERIHGVHTAICDGQAASYHRGHLRERYLDNNTLQPTVNRSFNPTSGSVRH